MEVNKIGVLISWKRPSSDTGYTDAYIYRSDSETGTFTNISSQSISDTSYYDSDGIGSSWYKIRFYDSVNDTYSAYSDATQGNESIGYCSVDEVRSMTNLTEGQVADTNLAILIEMASNDVNADISIKHEDERVQYISEEKANDVNDSNLTYYTIHYPIGDKDNDYEVGTSDLYVYAIDEDANRNEKTVISVDAEKGRFLLSEAPSSSDALYVTYYSTNKLVDPPHKLVKMATIWLTASFAYSKINLGKAPRFKEGSLTVFRDTTAHKQYMDKYYHTINKINKCINLKDRELTS